MTTKRETLTSVGLLALRVGIGGMILVHGTQKIQGFAQLSKAFPDPIGLGGQLSLIMAIGAEFGCSLLLIAGLGSRLAAIPLAFTMIVALFMVHANDPWKVKELAAVYLLVFGSLILTGPGKFSLDHFWFGLRSNATGATSRQNATAQAINAVEE